jgi:hypothetical protein
MTFYSLNNLAIGFMKKMFPLLEKSKHYQGIIDAGATSIVLELRNMEVRGHDGVWAVGNYSVIVKDQTIHGNWFRILKRENGTWKIAMEVFARSGALDAPVPHQHPATVNRQRFIFVMIRTS